MTRLAGRRAKTLIIVSSKADRTMQRRNPPPPSSFLQGRKGGERAKKGDGMRRRRVKSLIYAPDKKMRNSIRPPKSASSIFVVRNVTAAVPPVLHELPAHGLKNFPWDIS
ncbi:unnamed protein product [Lasius platythorax]|uniref:Uncharacterized protein n=1 Tax=Lasius platythorax TaxID=488582 RepID=A0AAV2P7F8_9HYME